MTELYPRCTRCGLTRPNTTLRGYPPKMVCGSCVGAQREKRLAASIERDRKQRALHGHRPRKQR